MTILLFSCKDCEDLNNKKITFLGDRTIYLCDFHKKENGGENGYLGPKQNATLSI